MELEIVSKGENQLLERIEVTFKTLHTKEGTPQRDAIRDKLSALLKVPKDRVVVDSMESEFGKTVTVGYAKIYATKDAALKYEREHILIRNKLKDKAGAKPAEQPAKAE